MALLALALRFVPYSDDHGNFDPLWTAVIALFGILALAASVYLVEVLEILKLRQTRLRQLVTLRRQAGAPEPELQEVNAAVERSWRPAPSPWLTRRRASSRRSTPWVVATLTKWLHKAIPGPYWI